MRLGFRRLLSLACAFALAGGSVAAAGDGSKPKKSCPSLAGAWSGGFDGSATGTWNATFRQSGDHLTITATIHTTSYGSLVGKATATVRCTDGVAEITGDGKAGSRSGSFSGVAHRDGRYLLGTWNSQRLAGSWNGEK